MLTRVPPAGADAFVAGLEVEFEHAAWSRVDQVRHDRAGELDPTARFYQGVLRDKNRVVVCSFRVGPDDERGYDGAALFESESMIIRVGRELAKKACEKAEEKLGQ